MTYLIITILVLIILFLLLRYIKLKDGLSLIGYLTRLNVSIITYIFRNKNKKMIEEYKKINTITKWNVKEGTFSWYSIKNINIDGVESSILTPKNIEKEKIILQLHGGGYEIALPSNNLYFAKKYGKLLKDFQILTINYRVAPEDKYPAALEDAIKAYKWMLKEGYHPKNIILAGDSSGGGLAIATVIYLRDNKIELPKAIITMSPWTDLSNSGESFTKNYKIDPVFGNSNQGIVNISTYAEGKDKKDPYISPKFGDFVGLPKMLMQVGSYEMLLSDTIDVAKEAREAGVDVSLSIYKGMFHIFQKCYSIIPESNKAWNEVRDFVTALYNE